VIFRSIQKRYKIFWLLIISTKNYAVIYNTWYATSKVLPLGEDRDFITFEQFGGLVSEDGTGLFHGATARGLGSYLMEKGVSKSLGGYHCFFLKNGDKVFTTYTGEIKTGVPTKGKMRILGGTGRCAGIQGGWEFTCYPLRPAAEGIGQSYCKFTIKYQLP
jgi:hypothetical protein